MSSGRRTVSFLVVPPWLTIVFTALLLLGTGAFLSGIFGSNPLRAWQAYLVNFLFWTGLSFGAVLFVAILNMTASTWGRPLKRLGEAFGAFLPVGFLLFWVLYFGRMELFPWILKPVPGKEIWLNAPFLFVRNGVGLLLLTLISLAMVYFSLRGDREWTGDAGNSPDSNWKRQRILSPILGIAYAFVLTLIAFDLIMSLDRHWYSTLLGAYFLVGCFYTGVAALCLVSLILAGSGGIKEHVNPRTFHDLGKLLLAFCLFTGYLFYAQFLTIWYGNLPEETRYVILRVKLTPWEPLAWVVLSMVFAIPFVVLLSRRIKLKRAPMMILSLMILAGMWLEKFILVVPSLWKQQGIPLGVTEVLITTGYAGVLGLCVIAFLKRVPVVPVSDPLFREWAENPKERLAP
jgi:hypothetical protein